MKFLPKTLFGRLFLLIFSFMIAMIVLMRILFALFISNQVGQQFSNLTQSLSYFAQELNAMGFKDANNQFAEHLKQSTGLTLLWNTTQPHDALPNITVYNSWGTTLAQQSNHSITMSYQALPQKTIWLHHHKVPQFSLGIPEVYRAAINKMLGVYVVIALFFSLFSAYIAALFLNRSLKNLATKARLIGQDINNTTIEPSGPIEIREVGLAMNTMQTDIDRMINKQKFLLANISHDLRTPLTRLHVATKILAPKENELTRGIHADIEEMNLVLHRFIELARFNIEETEHWQIGDLGLYITEVVEKFQQSNSDIELSFGPMPHIRYKPLALQSYLYNLINNSIKHGGGKITISAEFIDNTIALVISDYGPGFPLSAEELRSYSDLDLEHKSVNGLGLRIVQLIAKLHEAKLTLRNKPEGGAEVLLKLNETFARSQSK